jgi:3-methyladenine DNA glycosylase/8-oxoguanine DNA glycosylase
MDLRQTLGGLQNGGRDPTFQFTREGTCFMAFRSPDGPVSMELHGTRARAWGPGADWALERHDALIGADDPMDFDPQHRLLKQLHKRRRGARLAKTYRVTRLLMPVVMGQLITWREAIRGWTMFCKHGGEAAPGPVDLMLAPSPKTVLGMPWYRMRSFGLSRRHAEALHHVARRSKRMEEAAFMNTEDCERRLRALPGIGPWTANSAMVRGMGHADAVITGDFHLPNDVAWALAGEERADDARMLELLEPFRPHRGRVISLILSAGIHAPKRGPKLESRPIY